MGKRLKQLLETLKMKQNQFAQNIDVSPSHVSDVLTGRRNGFSMEVVVKIAMLYSVNLNWLLAGEGEMFITSPSNGEGVQAADSEKKNVTAEVYADAPDIDQITATAWFKKLSREQKEIIAGLAVIKDKDILKKVSAIIISQVTKERAHEELNRGLEELGGSGAGKRKR